MKSAADMSNLDDFSDKEKIIRYRFSLALQAYFIDRDKIKSFRTSTNVKVNLSETSILL